MDEILQAVSLLSLFQGLAPQFVVVNNDLWRTSHVPPALCIDCLGSLILLSDPLTGEETEAQRGSSSGQGHTANRAEEQDLNSHPSGSSIQACVAMLVSLVSTPL